MDLLEQTWLLKGKKPLAPWEDGAPSSSSNPKDSVAATRAADPKDIDKW